ncbi:MAG: BrnT family toxin [Oxalobacter formigenes]|nr:BrnT family toxin [Oxalobacter formigenes]
MYAQKYLGIASVRNGEKRTRSFAYVFGKLAALLAVHAERVESIRIISFRYASEKESGAYYERLENEFEKTTDDT